MKTTHARKVSQNNTRHEEFHVYHADSAIAASNAESDLLWQLKREGWDITRMSHAHYYKHMMYYTFSASKDTRRIVVEIYEVEEKDA